MNKQDAQKIAQELGFKRFFDLRETKTIAAAVKLADPPFETLSGIYLHIRPDDFFYIGKAGNFVTRHTQHMVQKHPVDFLAFCPCPAKRLFDEERVFIERAQHFGIPLINRLKTEARTVVDPKATFDDFVPPDAQERFIESAAALKNSREADIETAIAAAQPGEIEAWQRLMQHPCADAMLEAAARFIRTAVPMPYETERLYWTLITAPFNDQNGKVEMLSVLAGLTNVCELFVFSQTREAVFGALALATPTLYAQDRKFRKLLAKYPWAYWTMAQDYKPITADELMSARPFGKTYESPQELFKDMRKETTAAAMRDHMRVMVPLPYLKMLLDEPLVAKAAAVQAISSMRASTAMTADMHNPIAARACLGRIGVADPILG